jgi:glutamine synthetase
VSAGWPEAVARAVATSGARLARLQFTDILGSAKEVTVPVARVSEALDRGVTFDGSSIEGFVRTAEADMRLRPDPDTARAVPGAVAPGEATVRMVADICSPDGGVFPGCARSVLRRAVAQAEAAGLTVTVAAEVEFFLFDASPAASDRESAPRSADRAGYFDLGTAEDGEEARRAVASACVDMGLPVVATHHEVGPAQHEVDLGPSPPVAAADHVMAVRWLARALAPRFGLRATFMPKPLTGLSGNGLHLSLRLAGLPPQPGGADGAPAVPTLAGQSFLAGILAHAAALSALAGPVVNSYKRLVPGFEAPLYATWSTRHRSPLIRVPPPEAGGVQVLEYRGPDGAANPYLVLAAVLGCGLWGMERRTPLRPPVDRGASRMSAEERRRLDARRLPATLAEALDALEADGVVRDCLGEAVVAPLLEARRIEWELYERAVHGWEREQYLDRP